MGARNDREVWVYCGTLYTPFEKLSDAVLHIVEGRVSRILPAAETSDIPESERIYDPEAIVAPGYIDLHVHGARGHDVMDGSRESLQAMSYALASHGTTSFLATTLSASRSDTEVALRGFRENYENITEGARPLGLHMEGPYLNPMRKGTHDAAHLRHSEVQEFRRMVEVSGNTIRKLTIAPEMDAGLQVIAQASRLGIQISMGHSDSTAEQARVAVDAGARSATHTFNAMRPFHQREPGILGLVLTDERVYTEIIADGIHVHPTAIRLLLRVKGVDRMVLITDGTSAVDMPDGRYPLGDKMVMVQQGECRDSDGTLAGSTLTLDQAVRNLVKWLDIPLREALAAASATPARSIRLASKGTIASGVDADLVFLDSNLTVLKTMVAGRIVYRRNSR